MRHRLRSCEVPVRMRARTTGASAISSMQAAYYMIKVLLAVFVGLFRIAPDARARRSAGERPHGHLMADTTQRLIAIALTGGLHHLHPRARPPQGAHGALRDPLAALGVRAAPAGRVEGPAHDDRVQGRHPLPAVLVVRGRVRRRTAAAAALLTGHLEPHATRTRCWPSGWAFSNTASSRWRNDSTRRRGPSSTKPSDRAARASSPAPADPRGARGRACRRGG